MTWVEGRCFTERATWCPKINYLKYKFSVSHSQFTFPSADTCSEKQQSHEFIICPSSSFFKKDFIYLFTIDIERERERGAEIQAEGEAGSMPGAWCGTRSWDSRIAPWAKGRHQTAEPPRDSPSSSFLNIFCKHFASVYKSVLFFHR